MMDITQYPADIWGIIFSQLDIRSIVCLALTCRRFYTLFGTMSTNALFGDTWQICHRGNINIPIDRMSSRLNRKKTCQDLITYTGLVPEQFRQLFEESRGTTRGRSLLLCQIASNYMTGMKLSKSSVIDYHVLIDEHQYHVFRLTLDYPQRTYIQFHRNGNVMIRTSYQGSTIIDCQIFNDRRKCVISIYWDKWNWHRERPGKNVRSWSAYKIRSRSNSDIIPPYIPQVISPDNRLYESGGTLSEIRGIIHVRAIKAIYLTP